MRAGIFPRGIAGVGQGKRLLLIALFAGMDDEQRSGKIALTLDGVTNF